MQEFSEKQRLLADQPVAELDSLTANSDDRDFEEVAEHVREAIERLQASIEPALTVILGLLLLAVMSAVMMPIYDIVSRMKL